MKLSSLILAASFLAVAMSEASAQSASILNSGFNNNVRLTKSVALSEAGEAGLGMISTAIRTEQELQDVTETNACVYIRNSNRIYCY